MSNRALRRTVFAFILTVLCSVYAVAQAVAPFNAAALAHDGDQVKYGSYLVIRVGDGIFKINDPGVTTGKGGAWGVDMYMVKGKTKAMVIDLGNNYVDGYVPDVIAPRPHAAEEFRAVVFGLAGKLPVEAMITHEHPDHDGMTGALLNIPQKVKLWLPENEDKTALMVQHKIDPAVYTRFAPGTEFDLGGGRKLKSYQVRGHSNGSSVYLLTPDVVLFTGDSIGSGFGQAFPRVETLKMFAEDSMKLVEALKATLTPWQRYQMKVYTGHAWQNVYAGWWAPNHPKVDVGYLDWRFVQDVASCADGILKGKWLQSGSGLVNVGKMEYTDAWPGAAGRSIMVYGTGTVITTMEAAYAAAGITPPAEEKK